MSELGSGDQVGRVYLVISWDRQTDHEGKPLILTSVKQYEDAALAADVYRDETFYRGAVFLYVTDDSGHMELILEHERLPGYGNLGNLGRPATSS